VKVSGEKKGWCTNKKNKFGSSITTGLKSRSVFQKIGVGLYLKIVKFTVHYFKISEKIKISKIYVKKLDRILRLLVDFFL
jgi:hypothetical protein